MHDASPSVLGDPARLAALRALALLDAPEEAAFARLARLATALLGVPIALVSLVDADRQFFAGQVGLPEPWASQRQTPLSHSFCRHVVANGAPLVVADARDHPLLKDNLAIPDLGVVAYAGLPLIDAAGQALGSFCAIDSAPRDWDESELALLRDLAALAMTELAHRALVRESWHQGEAQAALLDAAGEGVFAADAHGRCTFANPRGAALLGLAPAALVGRDLHDLCAPHDADGVPCPRDTWPPLGVLRTGAVARAADETIRGRDGARVPVAYCAAPIAAGTAIGGVVVTVADSTGRRRAEAELRASARRFRALFADAGIGIALVAPTGRLVETNRALQESLGYTADELRALTFAQITHPDDVAVDLARYRGLVAGERDGYQLEKRYICRDGRAMWGHLTVSLIRDEHGRPEYAVGMVEDITARKAAAAALRASEARHRAVVDTAHDAIVTMGADGTIRAFNRGAERIFGYAAADVLGAPLSLLMPERYRDAHTAGLARHLATGAARVLGRPLDLAGRRADGVEFPLELTIAAWRDGEAAAFTGILRDVSARELARAALAASEARLAEAQRVAGLGSWEFDYATRTLTYSDEAFRIGGHAPQAWVPTAARFLAAVHPADRARVGLFLAHARAGAEPLDLDYRLVRPDGAVRVVHQRAALLRDAAGGPTTLVGTVLDVTDQRALEARLAHQATHDTLTGLPNRALFLDRLGQALGQARAGELPGAVLFLDLDHFKDVNDSRGHDAGDRLLVAVAARLRGALRDRDTLARLGGDEFAVLLAGVADAGGAARAAERLLAALAAPLALDGQAHTAGGSLGIVLATAEYARPEDVLRDADVALYRAKDAGRGGYALFDPAMQAALLDRLALERDLAGAAARGELRVYYQPKVDLATGRATFLEALVRWEHPTRGLIPPGDFIPLAEEAGLIVPLGRWVLETACRQLAAWHATYPDTAPALAVNLSPRQFRDPGLASDVGASLAASGLPADRLTLEVTESVAMERIDETLATLRALKALGLHLALDDFGTGHSALAYLRQLPLDTLKIDRGFFAEGPENRAIVQAVTDLAHGLGLDVTAEGLETADQVAWARAAGCERGQGFYFARPLPADALAALLAAGLTFSLPAAGPSATTGARVAPAGAAPPLRPPGIVRAVQTTTVRTIVTSTATER